MTRPVWVLVNGTREQQSKPDNFFRGESKRQLCSPTQRQQDPPGMRRCHLTGTADKVHKQEITELLCSWGEGDRRAMEALLPRIYDKLHRIAANQVPRQATLQPEALINELFISLVAKKRRVWQNRLQFFAVAALEMREILIDHARKKRAARRGGDRQHATLISTALEAGGPRVDLLALDEALTRLARLDASQARVVVLRFFGGLSEKEIATVMGITTRTVLRKWTAARIWLFHQLRGSSGLREVT